MDSVGLLKRGFSRDNDRRKAEEATIHSSIVEDREIVGDAFNDSTRA